MTSNTLKETISTIPHQPGIYKYYDKSGQLLYVGKAKDLFKRVSSYFTKQVQGYKTHELVKRIHRIEYTIVNSEQDAFFLENALIKAHQPRYNINLKDDKTYPYIVIKKEPYPRVFLTRKRYDDGSEYLGPFTSVARVRELLTFVRQHVQLRTCKLPLNERNIAKGKFKVCLEYHLGNCKGPCAGLQSEADYAEGLQQLRQMMRGKLTEVVRHYREEMQDHIADLAFEKAEAVRKKIEHLELYSARSVIAGTSIGDADVFSLLKEDHLAYINYLMVRDGTIIQTHSQELTAQLDETPEEVLSFGIRRLRELFDSRAPEIIVPLDIDYPEAETSITIPKAGDKKKLLDLSEKNVGLFVREIKEKKMLHLEKHDEQSRIQVLYAMQDALSLPELPVHIECFDNSNFQGSYPVSAMVCFKQGVPSKADYRKFNVKTVEGINDFATMQEVITRRYRRLLASGEPWPQLVIIDGGKGQLSAAMEAMESIGASGYTTLIGLAKNVEEIFFPGDSESVKLPYNSPVLKLIRRIRDEVHRFGITFHRQQRSKGALHNSLEDIPGIGRQTAQSLLTAFKSLRKIKEATESELANVVGKARAAALKKHFAAQAPES